MSQKSGPKPSFVGDVYCASIAQDNSGGEYEKQWVPVLGEPTTLSAAVDMTITYWEPIKEMENAIMKAVTLRSRRQTQEATIADPEYETKSNGEKLIIEDEIEPIKGSGLDRKDKGEPTTQPAEQHRP